MSDYQKLILDRVAGRINDWLDELKDKRPELLLTRQWRILWLKGFTQGQNIVPVITTGKDGEHLIGEIQIVLPPSLELDIESVELVLKEEPYSVPETTSVSISSLDSSLDLLNDLVVGLNGFLSSTSLSENRDNNGSPVTVGEPLKVRHSPEVIIMPERLSALKEEILKSPSLPEWYEHIENSEVAERMLTKLAEGYHQYTTRKGYAAPLKAFFDEFTEALSRQGKLYYHCPYKGRSVDFDASGRCRETFCSKKPHNAPCPIAQLRFGTVPTAL